MNPITWGAALVAAGLSLACGQESSGLDAVRQALDERRPEVAELQTEVQALYLRARAAGEDVPDDVSEWIVEDFGRIGAWEYATVRVPASDPDELQRVLAERGTERWECFHVMDRDDGAVLLFKRHMRSYLGAIPLREVLRLVALSPSLGSDAP